MIARIRREPVHAKVERATHCSSSRGVSPTRNESKRCGERRTEIRSEHSRGQYGIEIARGEGRCGRLRFGMTRRVARTRFSGRRLHEASPTGPVSPEPGPLCLGCVVLPEAIQRCPGQKGMTVL